MGQCVKCIEAPRNIFGGKFPIVLELLRMKWDTSTKMIYIAKKKYSLR